MLRYRSIEADEAIRDNYPAFKWMPSKNLSQEDYANKNAGGVWYLPAQIPKYNALYFPWIEGSVSVVRADVVQDVISWS